MERRVLIAPNSFKESAASTEIAGYFYDFLPDGFVKILKPISDGGDGFLDVCKFYFGGEFFNYSISTPYSGDKRLCEVLFVEDQKKIFIESANVLGLKVIPIEKRKPLYLNSKGLGELLIEISRDVENGKLDVSDVVIGIGGTGTMDMGIGACSQLGLRLLDTNKKIIDSFPYNFEKANSLNEEFLELPFNITCIIDVNTSLLGSKGAIKLYGSQKGATLDDIKKIEDGLSNIVNLLKYKEIDVSDNKLNGAGGGLATGLQIFLNAKLVEAKNYISELMTPKELESVDYIITGEGAFDYQSLEGKGAGIIIKRFENSGKKIYLICGNIEETVISKIPENVMVIELSKFFKSKEESITKIKEGIRLASLEIIKHIN